VFSEPIEASLATISVVNASGTSVSVPATGDPHDVHAVLATPTSLAPGEYRVVWRIVSADGHPVGGSFVFGIGARSARDTVPDVAPVATPKVWGPAVVGAPIIPAILRGAGVGSLLALTGFLWFSISSKSGSPELTRRVALYLAVAAPVLLIAHLFTWLANTAPEHRVDAAWISASFATPPGRAELTRTALAIIPLWALGLARRPSIAFGGGVLALLATAAVGHSAAVVPEWAIPFKAIHLLALSIWAGGLVWILAGRRASDPAGATRDIKQISSAAFWAVIAVAFSGIVQTRVLMSSWSDLASVYGAVVMAKAAGLMALVAFGAHHRRLIARFVTDHGAVVLLRRSVSREVVVFSIVLLLAGFLAYLSPPMARSSGPSPASTPQ
jgi:copper transport protein